MPTVGEILRSEREKKGLTIKDIEKATSIRALYLSAIEEDNYSIVPGEVYLKGFIRNYANYLGLDSQKIIDVYRQSKTPVAETLDPIADTADKHADHTNKAGKKDTTEENRNGQTSTIKWGAAVAIVVVLAGFGWWWAEGRSDQNPAQQAKPSPTAPAPVPQPAPQAPGSPAPLQQPTAQMPAAAAKPVVISAKYTDSCWTLVKADGKEVYEGIPKVGETLTWEAQTNINIQFGNAGGVEVVYNGQSLGKMGAKGEVLSKSFAANTVNR